MNNPRTTILGYLVLAAALIHAATAVLKGDYGNLGIQDIFAALAGIGLIGAKDGGH